MVVGAHAGAFSYEEKVGTYYVDVGYTIEKPIGGDHLVFDFNLFEGGSIDSAEAMYDRVWVRISYEKEAFVATGVSRQPVGPTTLLFNVPKGWAGDMEVFVRYEKGPESLAETTFTIPVLPGSTESALTTGMPMFVGIFLAGGLVGGVLVWIVGRRRMVR